VDRASESSKAGVFGWPMTLHSAPGRRSRQPHRHHRSAGPVLDPNRRCLAARSRRPARPKAGARWEQRSDPHRGNRYHVCDRLEGPLSHRRTGLHIFRSRYRPDHHHPRLPHRQARPDGLTEKFQIFLARIYALGWPRRPRRQRFRGTRQGERYPRRGYHQAERADFRRRRAQARARGDRQGF